MLMFLFATSCYTLFVILNMKNGNGYPNIVKFCIVFKFTTFATKFGEVWNRNSG